MIVQRIGHETIQHMSHHTHEQPIKDAQTKKLISIMKKRYPHLSDVKFRYLQYPTQYGSSSIKKVWIEPNLTLAQKSKTIKHELRHVEQYRAGINTDVNVSRWERDAEAAAQRLFADDDKDGVPNVFDCAPKNPKKQDRMRWY